MFAQKRHLEWLYSNKVSLYVRQFYKVLDPGTYVPIMSFQQGVKWQI